MRSPLVYYGGKAKLANLIVSLFPKHKVYVDVFGGGASVLFAKKQNNQEVYNDIFSDLVNFWRTLRSKDGPELIQQLKLTPHSREEHTTCKKEYQSILDPIERARQFFVLVRQSYAGTFANSYGTSIGGRNQSRVWVNSIDSLSPVIERLRNVQLENLDFRELIPKYDTVDTLFYCDPPYVHSSRSSKSAYNHEMTDIDHNDLLDILLSVKGKVVLSGYESELYAQKLKHWHLVSKIVNSSAAKTPNKIKRTEMIWSNFVPNRWQIDFD